MKKFKLLELLKKLFSESVSETYILISGGLTGFFIIFLINAMLGLYSVFGISADLTENLSGINMARNAQIALHEQVLAWENILISGKNYSDFQKNYHLFSRKAESVQNKLVNLKILNSHDQVIHDDIEKLLIKHKVMTGEFTNHIVDMKDKEFRNVQEKIKATSGMEDSLLESLNRVASEIENTGDLKSRATGFRYLVITSVSAVILIVLIIYYGRQIGRRLLKTHNILEKMVVERTREYVEANLSLQKEIDEHKITEQKLITSRNETEEKNRLLTVSERRYRLIVEGTREVVFTLDDNWYFKTANDAIKQELKISPDAVTKFRFVDLICDELTEATMLRRIVTEKLEQSKKELKKIKFNAQLKTPNLIEPVEFKITLEFIEIEGNLEIIGKAVRLADDRFTESFISEKCEYLIRNLLFEADDISHRITNNLQKYMDKTDINMIRIGLREIIINSIEHGNLNISFEDKTEAILTDRYFEFVNERQNNPEFRDKRVRIEYLISQSNAVYKITDQGKGFNHRKFMAAAEDGAGDVALAHGRGIAMVKNIFDEVRYNFRGNQVLLVKHLNKDEGFDENGSSRESGEMQSAEIG
ncbi:MAG TPA: ATP-binding protein [Spirochaetota bacterium]|nr:ATP-binding protein [Spirochaetota bacterium]